MSCFLGYSQEIFIFDLYKLAESIASRWVSVFPISDELSQSYEIILLDALHAQRTLQGQLHFWGKNHKLSPYDKKNFELTLPSPFRIRNNFSAVSPSLKRYSSAGMCFSSAVLYNLDINSAENYELMNLLD